MPALVLIAGACTHNIDPNISPTKIASVWPPIQARALLLITPAFEAYTTTEKLNIHTYNYRLGASAAQGMSDLVRRSFTTAQVKRVADVDLTTWLTGPSDTTVADVLLVPQLDAGGTQQGVFTVASEVRLSLHVRPTHGTSTYTWGATGRASQAFSDPGDITANALEQALNALSDSLKAHRAPLEVTH